MLTYNFPLNILTLSTRAPMRLFSSYGTRFRFPAFKLILILITEECTDSEYERSQEDPFLHPFYDFWFDKNWMKNERRLYRHKWHYESRSAQNVRKFGNVVTLVGRNSGADPKCHFWGNGFWKTTIFLNEGKSLSLKGGFLQQEILVANERQSNKMV